MLRELRADGDLVAEFEDLLRTSSAADSVIVSRQTLRAALRQFAAGRVNANDLTEWAGAIEARDEVRYEPEFNELIATIVFEIATPEINRPLTQEVGRELLDRLPP